MSEIPDFSSAVERAARAIRNNTVFRNPPNNDIAAVLSRKAIYDERGWNDITDYARSMWLSDAQAALTAAGLPELLAVVEAAKEFVPRVRMDTGKPYSTHNLNTDCVSHNGECSHCDFCGMPWPCETERLRSALATLAAVTEGET